MPLFDPILPKRYLVPMFEALAHAPKELRLEWQAAAGIGAGGRVHDGASITLERFDALVAKVLQHPELAAFGFEIGLRVRLADHGPLVPAMRRCRTLEERMVLQCRFSRLMTPIFALSYRRRGNQGELLCRPAAPMRPATLHTMFELYVVTLNRNLPANVLAAGIPYHMYMSMERPRHFHRYQALTSAVFHFGQGGLPQWRAVFPASLLAMPLRSAEDERRAPDTPELDILQRQIGRTTRCRDWVRLLLGEAEAIQPSAQDIAELLSVSKRTLERALAHEGAGFRELAREVRHERACAMLRESDQTLTQVAYRLGYSDLAAFSHAFQAIAEVSPSAYRLAA